MGRGLITNTRRSWAFARHMPPSKLIRRVELDVRRRVRDRLASGVAPALPLARVENPPLPIFEPRTQYAPTPSADGRLQFTFLGRAMSFDAGAIDWNGLGRGSETQLWRMMLHYMEYLEGVDNALWAILVEDWINENGAGGPGTWRDSWNSYALSLRIVVWLQELARRKGDVSPSLVATVEESAVRQMLFLEKNLETDLGGNHLIKNIKALIWAGAYFSGPEAARWQRKGIALLEKEMSEQVLADGFHYERSPSYHAQVFADLLECRAALGNDPLNGRLDMILGQMAQVIVDAAHPDGYVAQFNDAGLTMAYTPDACLAAYQALGFQRPEQRERFSYETAGYFGFRSRSSYFVCDCGEIAPDDLPAHGHGDILSFEWSVGGQRIIVDPGVYEYIAGDRRAASRSAATHNTLCLEEADQADFFGAFRCGRRPKVDVLNFEETERGIVLEGRHNGFTHLPGRPVHRRQFDVSDRAIQIKDWIAPPSDRAAMVGLLLHPDVTATQSGSAVVLSVGPTTISVSASQAIDIEPAVWWPDMGSEYATRRLRIALPAGVNELDITLQVLDHGPAETGETA